MGYNSNIRRRGKMYVAYLEDLPGVTAQGATPAEARRLLELAYERLSDEDREFAARSRARAGRRYRKSRK
jgi:predicted RNase H-like HicB family nuclease